MPRAAAKCKTGRPRRCQEDDGEEVNIPNETALGPHVYQKGPPNRGGVGHAGVGWVMQGWCGLYSGGVGCENFH